MTFFPSKTEGIQFILGYSVSDIITRKMNQRNAPPSLFSLPRRPCRTDGLPVHFPYAAIYPEKHVYMGEVMSALDSRGRAPARRRRGYPSSAPTVYSLANPSRQLRIYSTRTVGYVGTAVWVWGKSVRRQCMG